MTRSPRSLLALPLAALLLTGGCATTRIGNQATAERDPYEKFNRKIWGFDQFADRHVLKPVTKGYQAVAPRPVRQGVSNFFSNLTEPWSLVNNVLQGQLKRAGRNLKRFLVNSTIGLAGLMDHASKIGIRPANEDFGQTLARHGVNSGPYLVLPLLGPSTLRDAAGAGVAYFADPYSILLSNWNVSVWYKRGISVVRIISARSDLMDSGGDAFLETSLDPYAAARSAFLQHRTAEIMNQDDNPADQPPTGEAVLTPVGDAPPADVPAPAAPGATLPDSAAPLPGDAPAAPAAAPSAGTPSAATPLPDSAAPLPGDPPTAPAQPALPPSAAPLPGDPPAAPHP